MKDMEGKVPFIGTRGKYTLIKPWSCKEYLIYDCVRISSILDYSIQTGKDVLKEIYLDNGLKEQDYKYALENNIKIVTLKSDKEELIDVPDNYIELTPDMAFVPYRQYIISLNLGLLPEALDISPTLERLVKVIEETLNIVVKPKLHTYSSNRFVDWKTHVEMEESRKSGIVILDTQWQIIKDLEKKNRALSDAVNELEDALTSNT